MDRRNCSPQARPRSTLNIFARPSANGRNSREEREHRQYYQVDSQTSDTAEERSNERHDIEHWPEQELALRRSYFRVADTASQNSRVSDGILPEQIPRQSDEEECSGVDFGGCARVRE